MVRVWDCFPAGEELDLLEFRLHMLAPVVHRFVIVEARMTFTGKPKPLYVRDNLIRFADFADRIENVIVDLPALGNVEPRVREAAQRAAFLGPLSHALPDDLVLLGDLDEIPDPAVVRELATSLVSPTRLHMRWAMYRGNLEAPVPWIDGTKACRASQLQDVREMGVLLGNRDAPHMAGEDAAVRQRAGWHLSYVGSVGFVQRKVASICERQLDRAPLKNPVHLQRCIDLGVFQNGRFALRRTPEHELDTLQRELQRQFPDLIDTRPAAPRWEQRIYLAYSNFLGRGWIPKGVAGWIERWGWWLLMLLSPVLLTADCAYRLAVSLRPRHRARRLTRRLIGVGSTRGQPVLRESIHLHFWIPYQAPVELEEWDPDASPGLFADGLGHNIFELYARLARRNWQVSIGHRTPRNADAVVAFAKTLGRAPIRLRLFRQVRGLPLVVIRSDVPSSWRLGFRPTVEVAATGREAVEPWQRTLLPLPQRGLIPRDPARRGTVITVGYKGNPEQLPDFAGEDAWSSKLDALGVEWLPDMPVAGEGTVVRWHDLHDVDVAFCVRRDLGELVSNKPPTKLINAWTAGCIPIVSREPGYLEYARDGVDAVFADTEAEVLAAVESLRGDAELVARLEAAIAERARAISADAVLAQWEELLVSAAGSSGGALDVARRFVGVCRDIAGAVRRATTRSRVATPRVGSLP